MQHEMPCSLQKYMLDMSSLDHHCLVGNCWNWTWHPPVEPLPRLMGAASAMPVQAALPVQAATAMSVQPGLEQELKSARHAEAL